MSLRIAIVLFDLLVLYIFFGHSLWQVFLTRRHKLRVAMKETIHYLAQHLRVNRDVMTPERCQDIAAEIANARKLLADGNEDEWEKYLDESLPERRDAWDEADKTPPATAVRVCGAVFETFLGPVVTGIVAPLAVVVTGLMRLYAGLTLPLLARVSAWIGAACPVVRHAAPPAKAEATPKSKPKSGPKGRQKTAAPEPQAPAPRAITETPASAGPLIAVGIAIVAARWVAPIIARAIEEPWLVPLLAAACAWGAALVLAPVAARLFPPAGDTTAPPAVKETPPGLPGTLSWVVMLGIGCAGVLMLQPLFGWLLLPVALFEATRAVCRLVACLDDAAKRQPQPRDLDWVALADEWFNAVRGTVKSTLEVCVVALALAFGVRGLFLQPFKIPTGSMQPTLYGIHFEANNAGPLSPGPIKRFFDFAHYSRRYAYARIQDEGGYLEKSEPVTDGLRRFRPVRWLLPESRVRIGAQSYVLPGEPVNVDAYLQSEARRLGGSAACDSPPGLHFAPGQVLADGWLTLGDHLFVDRTRYCYAEPQRGDVTVFLTDGLAKRAHPAIVAGVEAQVTQAEQAGAISTDADAETVKQLRAFLADISRADLRPEPGDDPVARLSGLIATIEKGKGVRGVYAKDVLFGLQMLYSQMSLGGRFYIKRLCGLPHDVLQIRDHKLYVKEGGQGEFKPVDGTVNPAYARMYSFKGGYRGYCHLNGSLHLTSPDATFTLGADEFFMLGDNSENSSDSRFWGVVPRRNLVGRACVSWWPFSRRWGVVDRTEPEDFPSPPTVQ